MIDGLITILIYVFPALIFFQKTLARALVVTVYSIVTISHDAFGGELIGFWYYFSASLCDFILILTTSVINPITKLVVRIQKLSFACLVINFVGWVLYECYFDPIYYNLCILLIYIIVFYFFIKKENNRDDNMGLYRDTFIAPRIHILNYSIPIISIRNN
jgi:hypothetical protein